MGELHPEAERVLRALDERCAKAEKKANRERTRHHWADGNFLRLSGKADGLALARSYIGDALRGEV